MAQYNLAECLYIGNEKIKWYTKAAEQSLVDAQSALARGYEILFGNEYRDKEKAKEWIQKSADQGNEDAKVFLKKYF